VLVTLRLLGRIRSYEDRTLSGSSNKVVMFELAMLISDV